MIVQVATNARLVPVDGFFDELWSFEYRVGDSWEVMKSAPADHWISLVGEDKVNEMKEFSK